MDVEEARADWIRVRGEYHAFAKVLQDMLRAATHDLGIYAEVTARAKEVHSLVKKLILKPHLSYETLPDKVGARIVVRYRCELDLIETRIREIFNFKSVDDKGENLGSDKVGYQSIHVDCISLKGQNELSNRFPSSAFFAELQIRTLGQHLWADISHDTFYKNDELVNKLPPDLKRRVNLMAGLVEVADREFDRMYEEARPGVANEIFGGLEKLYYMLASKRPNIELSLAVINLILPLYDEASPRDILERCVIPTFEKHRQELSEIYSNPDNDDVSAFFFQPEALLIYDRLQFDRDQLLTKWNEHFPEKELDRVAMSFGFSLK
jgi:ppGpp synthetase/RelA/SpoT-type nucleotidyltranferase